MDIENANFSDDMKMAIKGAKGAAEIVMKYYKMSEADLGVELKADAGFSPVTIADKEVDLYLNQLFMAHNSNYGWLSEEIEDNIERLDKSTVWIVDPIDGTKSFINKDDCFAISIALVKNGKPVLGIVYAPATEEFFCAEKGKGAYKNGVKLDANKFCVINKAFGSRTEYKKGMLDAFKEDFEFENYGSIAYKLALVAEGAGVMFSLYPKSEWDCAAGVSICSEAGAIVSDIHGIPIQFNQADVIIDRVVAAPECAYGRLIEIIHAKVSDA
jgi:myo-inositol-1(or 4)-monophosphatase